MKSLLCIACFTFAALSSATYGAANDLKALIDDGDVHLALNYRFEHVDDNALRGTGQTLQQADASTLRTLIGYQTGTYRGIAATLDLEYVSEIGADDFNDGSNGKTQFATVADPSGLELEQAFIAFSGLKNTTIKGGRQHLTFRKAPLHRYIGTILWRQNWQTFDALSLKNTTLPGITINYAYLWRVNRIFGSDAPEPLSHFDSNSHLVSIESTRFSLGKLQAYSYLLDLNNAPVFSTLTYGARLDGKRAISASSSFLYAVELARQEDYADNPNNIDAHYLFFQGGLKLTPSIKLLDSLTLKLTYELLSGDGGADRFVTILGTNHAFQGWADRFLITPGDGISDLQASVVAQLAGTKIIAAYHDFSSDRDSYDYGEELNLLVTRKFYKRYQLGLKYAYYNADRNQLNISRNPGQSRDKSIFWAFAQFKY